LELADLRLELLVAGREAKAPLAHDLQVTGLDLEHVEVLEEATAGVEAAARLGDSADVPAGAQLLRVHHLAVEEAEDEGVLLRHGRDERRADSGLGRGDG